MERELAITLGKLPIDHNLHKNCHDQIPCNIHAVESALIQIH